MCCESVLDELLDARDLDRRLGVRRAIVAYQIARDLQKEAVSVTIIHKQHFDEGRA